MTTENEKAERIKRRVQKMRAFYSNLITYFLINILLVIINLIASPHSLWFYWVALIWGFFILVQGFNTFTLRDRFLGNEWEEKKIKELLHKEKRDKKP